MWFFFSPYCSYNNIPCFMQIWKSWLYIKSKNISSQNVNTFWWKLNLWISNAVWCSFITSLANFCNFVSGNKLIFKIFKSPPYRQLSSSWATAAGCNVIGSTGVNWMWLSATHSAGFPQGKHIVHTLPPPSACSCFLIRNTENKIPAPWVSS